MKRKKKEHKPSIIGPLLVRLFRPIFSIVTLSALILGISLFVREVSTASPTKVASVFVPVFKKMNIDVDQQEVEQVAGVFISRVTNNDIEQKEIYDEATVPYVDPKTETSNDDLDKDISASIAILADTHNSFENLSAALEKVKEMNIDTVLFLGDFTQLGIVEDLNIAKKIMDDSGLTYYAISGDHDLWKSVGHDNFLSVFEKNYYVFEKYGHKYILLDNSANFSVIPESVVSKFYSDLEDADFVFLSQPLYHPSNGRVMGIVDGETHAEVKSQADELLKNIRDSKVKAIISGDQHYYSVSTDPNDSTLSHIVVGALTNERNLQSPRFGVLNIYTDGTFIVKDLEL